MCFIIIIKYSKIITRGKKRVNTLNRICIESTRYRFHSVIKFLEWTRQKILILAGPPCCRNTELHWFYAISCRFQTEVNLKFGAYGNRKIKINWKNRNQQFRVTATPVLRVVLTRSPFRVNLETATVLNLHGPCWIYTIFFSVQRW